MTSAIPTHPHATPLPERLVTALLRRVAADGPDPGEATICFHDQHSNDVAELRFADGRALMVKRGRYPWAGKRFETSRIASDLLRPRGVIVPTPLPLPEGLDDRPVEAYWRIPLPTLQELWPGLSRREREDALRSLGSLLRRVHSVCLPEHGPLQATASTPIPLSAHLHEDLIGRLFPAVAADWPSAAGALGRLADAIPALASRLQGCEVAVVHNDLHVGNVLCEAGPDGVRCVGLLDLETAGGAPRESDLAVAQLHHGALFCQPLPDGWFRCLLEGYGTDPDPLVLSFYRAYHLANMGYYSALVGHREHAGEVARALDMEVETLAGATA